MCTFYPDADQYMDASQIHISCLCYIRDTNLFYKCWCLTALHVFNFLNINLIDAITGSTAPASCEFLTCLINNLPCGKAPSSLASWLCGALWLPCLERCPPNCCEWGTVLRPVTIVISSACCFAISHPFLEYSYSVYGQFGVSISGSLEQTISTKASWRQILIGPWEHSKRWSPKQSKEARYTQSRETGKRQTPNHKQRKTINSGPGMAKPREDWGITLSH